MKEKDTIHELLLNKIRCISISQRIRVPRTTTSIFISLRLQPRTICDGLLGKCAYINIHKSIYINSCDMGVSYFFQWRTFLYSSTVRRRDSIYIYIWFMQASQFPRIPKIARRVCVFVVCRWVVIDGRWFCFCGFLGADTSNVFVVPAGDTTYVDVVRVIAARDIIMFICVCVRNVRRVVFDRISGFTECYFWRP